MGAINFLSWWIIMSSIFIMVYIKFSNINWNNEDAGTMAICIMCGLMVLSVLILWLKWIMILPIGVYIILFKSHLFKNIGRK